MSRDDRKYSRVYHEAVDDPKFRDVWDDDACLALWVRLLVVADGSWPASATLPRATKARVLEVLVGAGLVDMTSVDRYRIHGMDKERGGRSSRAAFAAQSRWHADGNAASTATRIAPRNAGSAHAGMPSKDETSKDETSSPARDPWNDPERDAVSWLAKHGCALPPHSGYYRHLVTMTETHGVNAVVGMFDRLAEAGTRDGDVKGYVFGARDALDAKTRPSLADIGKADRAEGADRAHRARLDRTQAQLRELRGESA